MLASEWVRTYFSEGSRPDLRTVRGWVDDGIIVGRVIGRNVYIDINRFEGTPTTGNELADRILSQHGSTSSHAQA
jgi:hypothetical protein